MTSIAETMEMIADGTEPLNDEAKEVTDLSSRYVSRSVLVKGCDTSSFFFYSIHVLLFFFDLHFNYS